MNLIMGYTHEQKSNVCRFIFLWTYATSQTFYKNLYLHTSFIITRSILVKFLKKLIGHSTFIKCKKIVNVVELMIPNTYQETPTLDS